MNIVETDNLLVREFNDLDIIIYGTYENPLFKAKDIGDLLDIKKIRKTLNNIDDEDKILKVAPSGGGLQEQYFITENGLYELIFISKVPLAKHFKKWVKNVLKEIRLTGEYKLKQEYEQKELEYKKELQEKDKLIMAKEQEVIKIKEKIYEEIDKSGHVYIIKTDGGFKVGRSKHPPTKRAKNLQTGNVNDIGILFDYTTSNEVLLESVVHYVLDRYRTNPKREFFNCEYEHIKNVIVILGKTIDTLKSSFQFISNEELYNKLNLNIIDNNIYEERKQELVFLQEEKELEELRKQKAKELAEKLKQEELEMKRRKKEEELRIKQEIATKKITDFIESYVICNESTKEINIKRYDVNKLYRKATGKHINMDYFLKHIKILSSNIVTYDCGWTGFTLKKFVIHQYTNSCSMIPSIDFINIYI